jgi:tetratricopeptide (TPR) repeat protein
MRLSIGLALLLSISTAARAEDPAREAAKEHFRRGERLYAVAKFQEALDEFTAAYETKPMPEFLFNLGQCQRRLGHPDEAVFFYQGYLSRVENPPDRDEVGKLIAEMKAQIADRDREKTEAPKPPAANASVPAQVTVEAQPVYRRWWFWTTIVGVVVVAAAVAIGVAYAERTPALTYPGVQF